MKNFNRSPWLKAPRTGATRTLMWIARIHSHTYINAVTTLTRVRIKDGLLFERFECESTEHWLSLAWCRRNKWWLAWSTPCWSTAMSTWATAVVWSSHLSQTDAIGQCISLNRQRLFFLNPPLPTPPTPPTPKQTCNCLLLSSIVVMKVVVNGFWQVMFNLKHCFLNLLLNYRMVNVEDCALGFQHCVWWYFMMILPTILVTDKKKWWMKLKAIIMIVTKYQW